MTQSFDVLLFSADNEFWRILVRMRQRWFQQIPVSFSLDQRYVMNFRFKDDVMSMASNGWCKKGVHVWMNYWSRWICSRQEGGVWYLRLPYLLLRLTAVKCLQAVAPVWTGGHWSLTFFLNSPELCLIICRPTVVRATSDISNIASMYAVYCQYQLSTHYA